MKKIVSLVMCAALFVSAMIFPARAVEAGVPVRAEIIETACEIFPEYSSKILSSPSEIACASLNAPLEVVITETRPVTESRQITYFELSNGAVILCDSDYDVESSQTNSETSTGGVKTYIYTFTITRNNADGYVRISQFQYRIYPNDYDCILSSGVITGNDGGEGTRTSLRSYETSSQKATAGYEILLDVEGTDGSGGRVFVCDFSILVGNNTMNTSVHAYE